MFGASAFVYDDAYPPLCCRSDREVDLNVIRKAIGMHLVESSRDGVKHPDALLECGMTAGEAAVFHIRDISNRRRPVREDARTMEWMNFVRVSLERHFQLRLDGAVGESFARHVSPSMFETKQLTKHLSVALKHFLSEIQLKEKGYTSQLKLVLEDVEKKWNQQ